jgi:hypothetical protein
MCPVAPKSHTVKLQIWAGVQCREVVEQAAVGSLAHISGLYLLVRRHHSSIQGTINRCVGWNSPIVPD